MVILRRTCNSSFFLRKLQNFFAFGRMPFLRQGMIRREGAAATEPQTGGRGKNRAALPHSVCHRQDGFRPAQGIPGGMPPILSF